MRATTSRRHGARSARTRLIAIGAVAALTLAACGGDDEADTPPTTAAATDAGTSDSATADQTTAEPGTTDTPTDGTSTADGEQPADPDDVAVVFAAAGYDWSDVDLSDVTVTIGQLVPRSGDFTFLGDAMRAGAELAAEQIAAAGGPTIEFQAEDIGPGDPEMSTAGARTLVADGVGVIQSSFGPATLAVVPIVEQSDTLLFQTAGATADQLEVSEQLWMGRPTATDPFPALADYVAEASPEVTKAATMVWNEGSAIASAELITSRWAELGGELTLEELVDVGASDMGPSATRIIGSGAEVVFLVVFGGDTATAINALRDGGFEGDILGVDWNPGITEATGGGDAGFKYVTDAQDATLDDPFAQLYLSGYPEQAGMPIDVFSALFWDNTIHIADLAVRVVRAGGDPNDGAALIEALRADPSMPASSAGTPVGWDVATKAQTIKPHGFYEIVDGVPTLTAIVQDGELMLGASLGDLE